MALFKGQAETETKLLKQNSSKCIYYDDLPVDIWHPKLGRKQLPTPKSLTQPF